MDNSKSSFIGNDFGFPYTVALDEKAIFITTETFKALCSNFVVAVLAIHKPYLNVVHYFLDDKSELHVINPFIEPAVIHIWHIALRNLEIVADGIAVSGTDISFKEVADSRLLRLVHLLIRVTESR